MPTQLDGVSATVNGKSGVHLYISPLQVNILTPPDAISGVGCGAVDLWAQTSAVFMAQAQALAQSFFVFEEGLYVAAAAANGTYIGSTTLYPGRPRPRNRARRFSFIWQRIWSGQFGGTNRVDYAIGGVDTEAGGDDRRDRGEGAIRGIGGAGEFQSQTWLWGLV